jgi:2Fe-2S ferredoxin
MANDNHREIQTAEVVVRQPKLVFVQQNGERKLVTAAVGLSVMRAAVDNGVPGIPAECGGHLACGTCHVYVAEQNRAAFPAASALEVEMLGFAASECRSNSRLSCQLVVTEEHDQAEFFVPERQI